MMLIRNEIVLIVRFQDYKSFFFVCLHFSCAYLSLSVFKCLCAAVC